MGQPEGCGVGQSQAEQRACAGEDEALGQQLTHQPATACAQGDAQGELLGARGGAGEEQVGEVHANDEQDHSDCPPQDDE